MRLLAGLAPLPAAPDEPGGLQYPDAAFRTG